MTDQELFTLVGIRPEPPKPEKKLRPRKDFPWISVILLAAIVICCLFAEFLMTKIDPFSQWDITPVQARGWDRGKQFTPKQQQVLMERIGVDPHKIPYGQGKQLLDEYFRRLSGGYASLKQAALLKKRGFHMPLRHDQAGRMIGRMRERQGW